MDIRHRMDNRERMDGLERIDREPDDFCEFALQFTFTGSQCVVRLKRACRVHSRRDAGVRQFCRLLAASAGWLELDRRKSGPLLLHHLPQGEVTLRGLVVEWILDGGERGNLPFQGVDSLRVPVADRVPLVEQIRDFVGEARQPLVRGRDPFLTVTPELERDRQPIDLGLQFGQALFEARHFLKH